MITGLIIEDERVIRNGLLTHVLWKELGVDKVRVAEHADEVFELCKDFKPDIIVSDIKMPGMDGITLCRNLREQFKESQIIFVTGYSNKEYLKAAIDLHAICYVEKPVHIPEITNAVSKAVEEIKKSRNQKSVELYSLIMDSKSVNYSLTGYKTFCVFLLYLKQVKNPQYIKESIVHNLFAFDKTRDFHFMGNVINPSQIVFLISGNQKVANDKIFVEVLLKTLQNSIPSNVKKWFLAVGKVVDGQDKITESYQCALEVLKCLSFKGWNCIADMGELPDESQGLRLDKNIGDHFNEAVMKKNKESAIRILKDIYDTLIEQHMVLNNEIRYLYYSLNKIIDFANRTFHLVNVRETLKDSDIKLIDQAETISDIHEYLNRRIIDILNTEEEQKNLFTCKKITDYILENYKNPSISINSLAEYVYLTPTYLSNLFKKNMGITIGHYLVNVRVEFAKQYLKDPHLKLYQIASLVGYEDPNYFAKIFKKKTGVTPSEYREKL